MSDNASVDTARIVLATHLLVGLGIAGFGLFLLVGGAVAAAVVNLAIGLVVAAVGYRVSGMV